jgi:UDP-N-acetylglucosamine 2-epimerase (non-hydrolysing)
LQREGISPEKIFFVGNVMIDSLLAHREKAERSSIRTRLALNGDSDRYALVTLHRPSNVDEPAVLEGLLRTLDSLAARVAVVFPVHPRTQHSIEANGLRESLKSPGLRIVDPLGYLDFLHLMSHASLVITDSGGIQEETTVLGVPCLTVRHNTERPVTTEQGTNRLVGNDPRKLLEAALGILDGRRKNYTTPKFWDGRAAERIISVLLDQYGPADLRNRARGEPIAAGSNGQRFE